LSKKSLSIRENTRKVGRDSKGCTKYPQSPSTRTNPISQINTQIISPEEGSQSIPYGRRVNGMKKNKAIAQNTYVANVAIGSVSTAWKVP